MIVSSLKQLILPVQSLVLHKIWVGVGQCLDGQTGPNNKVYEDHEIQTVIETQESESFTMLENGNNLVENAQINNLTLPVTNNTSRSQGYGTVIIIKPTADNVKDLINNPVEIIKATKNSLFNCPDIKDIRVNKRKNILVAEMKESNSAK